MKFQAIAQRPAWALREILVCLYPVQSGPKK